jgi:arabinogalactan endo-1,4-beta-galactosidase
MKFNWSFCLIIALFLTSLAGCKPDETNLVPINTIPFDGFIRGADLSFLPELRLSGLLLRNAENKQEDALQTLQNAGLNLVRIRVWHSPNGVHSSLAEAKALSAEAKQKGLKVLITLHYSDTWADPGHQYKPQKWNAASVPAMRDSIFNYTKLVMQETQPDYIQIGNEINNGFLWPEGYRSNAENFRSFLEAGIAAVNAIDSNCKVIIHYAGTELASNFFAEVNGLSYDIIAISYYPIWHGKSLDSLLLSLTSLQQQFQKEILLVETSYAFTTLWNDWTNNVLGDTTQAIAAYGVSPEGQRAYLQALHEALRNVPQCIGFCYWGAEWMSYYGNTASNGSSWENQALWDFEGKALPAMQAFRSLE